MPTLTELGYDEFQVSSWGGVIVPVGTSAAQVARLHAAVRDVMADPETARPIRGSGNDVNYIDNATFRTRMRATLDQVAKAVVEAGIKVN